VGANALFLAAFIRAAARSPTSLLQSPAPNAPRLLRLGQCPAQMQQRRFGLRMGRQVLKREAWRAWPGFRSGFPPADDVVQLLEIPFRLP
jgi:hypothetical protein